MEMNWMDPRIDKAVTVRKREKERKRVRERESEREREVERERGRERGVSTVHDSPAQCTAIHESCRELHSSTGDERGFKGMRAGLRVQRDG